MKMPFGSDGTFNLKRKSLIMKRKMVLICLLFLLIFTIFLSQSYGSNLSVNGTWEACFVTIEKPFFKKWLSVSYRGEWVESCNQIEIKKWDESHIDFSINYENKKKIENYTWDREKEYGYSYFSDKPNKKLPFYLTKMDDEYWKGWSESPYGRVVDFCLISTRLKQKGKSLLSDFLNQDNWHLSMLGDNDKIDEYHPVKIILNNSHNLIFNSFHRITYNRTSYVLDKNKSIGRWITVSGVFEQKSETDQFMLKKIGDGLWKGWYKKPGDESHYGIKLLSEKILLAEIQKQETLAKKERVAAKQERVAAKQERAAETTFHCPETQIEGLTTNEAKALKYLINKKYIQEIKNICIEKLVAIDKFTLKQNTVVKYSATLFFPQGYKTECLNFKASDLDNNFTWSGWNKLTQQGCNDYDNQLDPLGGPLEPGGKKIIEGDEEI